MLSEMMRERGAQAHAIELLPHHRAHVDQSENLMPNTLSDKPGHRAAATHI